MSSECDERDNQVSNKRPRPDDDKGGHVHVVAECHVVTQVGNEEKGSHLQVVENRYLRSGEKLGIEDESLTNYAEET